MNSIEKLSSELENYITLISYSQPKVQAVTEEEQYWKDVNIVQLSAILEDIFEEVKQTTALKAKFISDSKGNKDFDAYSLTEDERCWFNRTLLEGAKLLFNKINYLSKNIPTAFMFDEGVIISDHQAGNAYNIGDYVRDGINIYLCVQNISMGIEESLSNKDYWIPESVLLDTKGKVVYNINNNWNTPDVAFTGMNNNIKSSLKYYVLAEWYKIPGLALESQTFEGRYLEELAFLIRNANSRICPIRRSYDPRP